MNWKQKSVSSILGLAASLALAPQVSADYPIASHRYLAVSRTSTFWFCLS